MAAQDGPRAAQEATEITQDKPKIPLRPPPARPERLSCTYLCGGASLLSPLGTVLGPSWVDLGLRIGGQKHGFSIGFTTIS